MSKEAPKRLIIGIITISLIGLVNTAYLAVKHYTGGSLDYNLLEYATVLGVPIAIFGMIYFLIFLMSGLLYYDTKNKAFLSGFLALGVLGLVTALWLLYLQFVSIKIICGFHMVFVGTAIILFILGLISFLTKSQNTPGQLE